MKNPAIVSPRESTRVKFQASSPSDKRSHHNPKSSHTSGLSAELKTKVIDAGMNATSYPKTGKEIKSHYLMNTVKIKPNSKGARATEAFSPLMQYMKDAKPIAKKKYSAKRQNGFKT